MALGNHVPDDPTKEIAPEPLAPEESPKQLEDGIALCLSGGGYRAMLFHAGALLRLNELCLLARIRRVSSVSGGSIIAATLGLHWSRFTWEPGYRRVQAASIHALVVEPLRALARHTIDLPSISWGLVLPGVSISDNLIGTYDQYLFDGATLQEFSDERMTPEPPAPRFVITATNVKTGSLWRFAKLYMADYRVGIVDKPSVPLAVAVVASSAFPPFLSPLRIRLDGFEFRNGIPKDVDRLPHSLRTEAVLTDGGVYDNLGLEPVWKRYKTVLISDGGYPNQDDLQPSDDWARHSWRLVNLLQQQVSNLRRRQTISAFRDEKDLHKGTYWGIQTNLSNYPTKSMLSCPHTATLKIAQIETRLAALSELDQERIINWGYAVCDMAVRAYLEDFKHSPAPTDFPFPETGLGT